MKGIPKITLEPANIVCPKCGNPNYMRHLIGANVGELDMKCINCNSYFNFDELYKKKIAEVVKPQTNGDRIRSMSDEELVNVFLNNCGLRSCRSPKGTVYTDCRSCWHDWLMEEAVE